MFVSEYIDDYINWLVRCMLCQWDISADDLDEVVSDNFYMELKPYAL